jgi:formyltetrahydrofolate-dependent phosphoribosylglycinamide formyltransferase
MLPASPLKLAVLISGSGTTLVNLAAKIRTGELDCSIELVIGSRANLKGMERAAEAGLPALVIDPRELPDSAELSERIFHAVDEVGADLVCLAGWLHLLRIPERYQGRVLNIHPSLLPRFGGKGMYGLRVHQAVIDSGCTETGCTVHLVDNEYDSGPIVLQRSCPVLPTDTPATLAARVFEQEKIAYPDAIRLMQGRIRGAVDRAGY